MRTRVNGGPRQLKIYSGRNNSCYTLNDNNNSDIKREPLTKTSSVGCKNADVNYIHVETPQAENDNK